MRSGSVLLIAALLSYGCSSVSKRTTASPGRSPSRTVRVAESSRDGDVERRLARLELEAMERDAIIEDLQARLSDARSEVVRAMAKLKTVDSRAEAASGMAEADVALQQLRSSASSQVSEAAQVAQLLRQSAAEFDRQNYGGALYLATQAKLLATSYRGSGPAGIRGNPRPGEAPFALAIRLKASTRGNVREGPGTGFAVAFSVESGAPLVAYSHTDEWLRVSDAEGRNGWISRTLVRRP